MSLRAEIPKIIHQTWKDEAVPRRFHRWRDTWRAHHPDWEYRLWTDADNRAFIERHYEWFLPFYDTYGENIMRVDAVRYFILDAVGGVFVDLDFECLRPLDDFLRDKRVVFGLEPAAHVSHILSGPIAREPVKRLVCNAFMASAPRHRFWAHTHQFLAREHGRADVLEATGPFFLTRAVESFDAPDEVKREITLAPAELFYPLSQPDAGAARNEAPDLSQAYAVHHWQGTWWRRQRYMRRARRAVVGAKKAARLILEGARQAKLLFNPAACEDFRGQWAMRRSARLSHLRGMGDALSKNGNAGSVWAMLRRGRDSAHVLVKVDAAIETPRVYCVARATDFDDLRQLQAAVEDYHRQEGVNKHLFVVDDCAKLSDGVAQLNGGDVEVVASLDATLIAVNAQDSEGVWVRWGNYRSHRRRLRTQLAALNVTEADICALQRHLRVTARTAFLAPCEVLLETVMQHTDVPPHALWQERDAQCAMALLDEPMLSVVVGETDDEASEMTWRGDALAQLLRALRDEFGDDAVATAAKFAVAQASPSRESQAARANDASDLPDVLILTPVKNAECHIPRYFDNLERIDYPSHKLSLAFLESDSDDATWRRLNEALPAARERYARVELYQQHFGYASERPRWAVSEQFRRRAIMARSRNALLARALREERWVLWMDVDLLSWPPDSLTRLLATGKDVIVPHCIREDGATFDLNTFILRDGYESLDWNRYAIDGILQPPIGYGRRYLGDYRGLVEVDGVGGTMLLVNADLHRQGLNFPPYPYRRLIETEGLAQMAKDMGHACWGLADLTIVHAAH